MVMALLSVILSGCLNGKYDPDLSLGEQIKTRHYQGSGEECGKTVLLDEILESVETKDVNRMKVLFSDYAVQNDDRLNDEIECLCNSFPQIKEIKNRRSPVSGGHNKGSTKYEYIYQPMADIQDSNGNMFRLICIWIEGDSEKPEKQGVHSIQLISKEMYDKHKFDIHSENEKPGVYVYISE